MKLLVYISVTFFCQLWTPTHDVRIAIFYISETNGHINMEITFDVEDLSKSLDINRSNIKLENIQAYIDNHTHFQFNKQDVSLQLSEYKIVRDHIKVTGRFGKVKNNIDTISVENTCMTEISGHSNIIQIDLNNKSKDFRMHKDRTIINLDY